MAVGAEVLAGGRVAHRQPEQVDSRERQLCGGREGGQQGRGGRGQQVSGSESGRTSGGGERRSERTMTNK